MRTLIVAAAIVLVCMSRAEAQCPSIYTCVSQLPPTCDGNGETVFVSGSGLAFCPSVNTWQWLATNIPSGAVMFISSGTCPAGFAEATDLNGKTLIGTLAANGNVGTTGGSDNVTPTIASLTAAAQTFTGTPFSSVINHTHTVSVTDPGHSHLTQRYPTATGGSSGFTIDTSMSGTLADNTLPVKAATTGITAATANPAGGVASITPAGTNSTSVVTGTLNQFDNRSAFVLLIGCRKS